MDIGNLELNLSLNADVLEKELKKLQSQIDKIRPEARQRLTAKMSDSEKQHILDLREELTLLTKKENQLKKQIQIKQQLESGIPSQKNSKGKQTKSLDSEDESHFKQISNKLKDAFSGFSQSGLDTAFALVAVQAFNQVGNAFQHLTSLLIQESSKIAIQFEKIKISVDSIESGGFEYAISQAKKFNLDLQATASSYQQIAASAAPLVDSGQIMASDVHNLFEGVTTASRAFNLSADDTQGALLAISQMLSKGTVQAEELRGQLGERIPGAFQIAAKSMGMTTAQLNKQLQLGNVSAVQFARNFGQQLRIVSAMSASSSMETVGSSVQQLKNTFLELQLAIGQSLQPLIKFGAIVGTQSLQFLSKNAEGLIFAIKTIGLALTALAIPALTKLATNIIPLVSAGIKSLSVELTNTNKMVQTLFARKLSSFLPSNEAKTRLNALQTDLKGLTKVKLDLESKPFVQLQPQEIQALNTINQEIVKTQENIKIAKAEVGKFKNGLSNIKTVVKQTSLLLAEMLAPLVAMEALIFVGKAISYAFNPTEMKEVNKQLVEMNQQLQEIARTYQTVSEAQQSAQDAKAMKEKQQAIVEAGYSGLGVFAKAGDAISFVYNDVYRLVDLITNGIPVVGGLFNVLGKVLTFPMKMMLGVTKYLSPLTLILATVNKIKGESGSLFGTSWGDIFKQNQAMAFDKAITDIGEKSLAIKQRFNSKDFLSQSDQDQLEEYKGKIAELEVLKQNAQKQKETSPEQAAIKEREIRQIEKDIQLAEVQVQRLTTLGDTLEGIKKRTELANKKSVNDMVSAQNKIEQLQIEGVNTQEETERQKAMITAKRVREDIANEEARIKALNEIQGADPVKRDEDLREAKQRLTELHNELLQSENQLRQAELNVLKAHLEKTVQEYERSNNKIENQLANAMTKFKARVLKLRDEMRITEAGATGLEAEARKKEAEENIKIEKNRLQQIANIRSEAMASLVGKELTDKLAELDQQEREVQSKILNLMNDITQARIDAKKAERDALNEQIDLEYSDLEMRTKRAFSRYANSQSEQERILRKQRIKDIKERIEAEEKYEGKRSSVQLTGNNMADIALLRKKFQAQMDEAKPYVERLKMLEIKGQKESLTAMEVEEKKWLKKRTDLHTKEWYDLQNQLTELELEERKARQEAINELNDLAYKDLETRTKYAIQNGLMTQEQADKSLHEKKREGLKSRLLYEENIHKEQLTRLNELQLKSTLQGLTDVEKAELEWLKTRANLYSTEYYETANQLIDLQTEAEKTHYDQLIFNIKRANQEKQLSHENEKARLDRELKAQDLITKSIEKQSELINLRESVNKAISDSFVQQNESQITNTKRALEIIKQLKSGELTGSESTIAREELAMLGYNAKSKELDLVRKIAELESQQLAQKWESLMREQAVQRQLLDIELKKMDITAKRDEMEAKSGLLEAKKAVLDATVAIAEAEKQQALAKTGEERLQSEMAVQNAQNQLLLSQQQVGLAEQNLGMVQSANQQQLEVKQLKQKELEITQKTAQQTTLQELYTKKYSYALENVKTLNEAINETGQESTQDIDRRVALAQAWAEDTGKNPMARDWSANIGSRDSLGQYAEFSMSGGGQKVKELREQYAKEDQGKQLSKTIKEGISKRKTGKGGWTTTDWVTPQFNAQLALDSSATEQVSVTDQLQSQIESGNATVEELKGIRSLLNAFKGQPMMTLNNTFKNVATNITPEELQRLRSETLSALVTTIKGATTQWAS